MDEGEAGYPVGRRFAVQHPIAKEGQPLEEVVDEARQGLEGRVGARATPGGRYFPGEHVR